MDILFSYHVMSGTLALTPSIRICWGDGYLAAGISWLQLGFVVELVERDDEEA